MPGIMKAGAKDPRGMVRNSRPYDPSVQPDQVQFARKIATEAGNFVPLADAMAQATQSYANKSRIQADFVAFYYSGLIDRNTPQLLIPRNANRSHFYILNFSGSYLFASYGAASGEFPGITIPPLLYYGPSNGVISIDEIWINSMSGSSHVDVLGYEGTPPIGGLA